MKLLESRLFVDKCQFLVHCLRKLLGGKLRKEIRKNLSLTDAVSYIDFSKGKNKFDFNIFMTFNTELELIQPEQTKGEAYGASNKTFMVIPQVNKWKKLF